MWVLEVTLLSYEMYLQKHSRLSQLIQSLHMSQLFFFLEILKATKRKFFWISYCVKLPL